MLRQLRVGLRRDGDPGAGGHIIQDHRHIHRVGDHLEVAEQPGLTCLVVVGGHHQQSVGPRPAPRPGTMPGAFSVELEPLPAITGTPGRPHGLRRIPRPASAPDSSWCWPRRWCRRTMTASVPLASWKSSRRPQGGQVHGLLGEGRDDGHAGAGEERGFQCMHAPLLEWRSDKS